MKFDSRADIVLAKFARAFYTTRVNHPSSVVQVGDKILSYGVDLESQKSQNIIDIPWKNLDQLRGPAKDIAARMAQDFIVRDIPMAKSVSAAPSEDKSDWLKKAAKKVFRDVLAHSDTLPQDSTHPAIKRAQKNVHDLHAYHSKGDWKGVLQSAKLYLKNVNESAQEHETIKKSLFAEAFDLVKGPKPGRESMGHVSELTSQYAMADHINHQHDIEDAYRSKVSSASPSEQFKMVLTARPDRIHGMVKHAESRWETSDKGVRKHSEALQAFDHLIAARKHVQEGDHTSAHRALSAFHNGMDTVQEKYGHTVSYGLAVNPRHEWALKAFSNVIALLNQDE